MNPDKAYDFQTDAIQWFRAPRPNKGNPILSAPPYVGLCADEMGVGKTITALETIEDLVVKNEKRILFLVPGNTVIQWQKQFDKWVLENEPDDFGLNSLYYIRGSSSMIPIVADPSSISGRKAAQCCVMSHNLLAKKAVVEKLIAANFDGIIIDEIHKFGTQGTKRIKHLMALMNMTESGFTACRIGLSGTPVRNYAKEIHNIAWFLGFPSKKQPGKVMGVEEFSMEYLTYDRKALYSPHKFHADFDAFYIRRTVDQVQKDMPEIRRTELYTEISDPVIAKLYNKELDVLENFMNNAERIDAFSLLGYLVRLKHLTGVAKAAEPSIMDPIYEYLTGEGSESGAKKACIGIHHRMVARRIQNYLGECKCGHSRMSHFHLDETTFEDIPNLCKCGCARWNPKINFFMIRGGMTVEQKELEKQNFIACKAPAVCLLSTKAAGEGIDGLQYATSKMYVLEVQWNMAEIRQLEKRIHRTGQTQKCQIEYSLATGTIDEFFWDMSKMKEKITTTVEDVNFQSNPKFLQTLAEKVLMSGRIKIRDHSEDLEEYERITAPKGEVRERLMMADFEV